MDAVTHEIIEKIRKAIYSYEFKLDSRTKAGYFTRESLLSFETMMMFMLRLVKKSMQIELNDYFDELEKESFVSKQAFSKARKKIRPEAFEKLFRMTYETGKDANALRYYKGRYRLLADDGTTVALESNAELIRPPRKLWSANCRGYFFTCKAEEESVLTPGDDDDTADGKIDRQGVGYSFRGGLIYSSSFGVGLDCLRDLLDNALVEGVF